MSSKEQTSPMVGGVSKSTPPTQWFVSEIQQMMHGLGDCRKPLQESAILVEEITQQQMISLLYKASDVASMRGSKLIGVEDILFLLRKDKVKLRRLLRYMDMKDLKATTSRSTSVDEEDGLEHDTKNQPLRKRRKQCYDFLSTIDQTGELLDLFDDEVIDDVKYERLLRADLKSRCLDPNQYLEFCEARQANFGRRYKSQRFKEWLLTGVNLDIKPGLPALEILSYMAYETVAQIVDLSLLVKRDIQKARCDPLVLTMPSITHNLQETATMTALMGQTKFSGLTSPTVSPPTTPSVSGQSTPTSINPTSGVPTSATKSKSKKKKKSGPLVTMETPVTKAILPTDIQEVMRRYTGFIGPFASELKVNTLKLPKSHILSC